MTASSPIIATITPAGHADRLASAQLEVLLTPEDVGRMLGVHPRTACRMAEDGSIPSPVIRRHRLVRWDPVTIKAWLAKVSR